MPHFNKGGPVGLASMYILEIYRCYTESSMYRIITQLMVLCILLNLACSCVMDLRLYKPRMIYKWLIRTVRIAFLKHIFIQKLRRRKPTQPNDFYEDTALVR